ncbi:MAG: hypothetical protein HY366_00545, partial [Candidatus Aenigmarchaeota archaeon]|nr:hypothetical protein [Candidatus Aenigmarchaeota archaeon]
MDLSRDDILQLCKKYNKEEDQWNAELESALGKKFRTDSEVTKEDLEQVIKWKFITNPHRLKRELSHIRDLKDSEIRRLSKEAFVSNDDKTKVKRLMEIKGVGPAVASTILTFYDPQKFCVFDIH